MWYNILMATLLRSPLHGLLSQSLLLLTYTGRKSGKLITVPVNYVRDGAVLRVTSRRERTWWRNLRGGVPVRVQLRGREVSATATIVDDAGGVAAGLRAFFESAPQTAKYFGVARAPNGDWDAAALARAVQDRVMIELRLD